MGGMLRGLVAGLALGVTVAAEAAGDDAPRLAARAAALVAEDGAMLADAVLLGRMVVLRQANGAPLEARIEAIRRLPGLPDVTLYALSRRDPRSGVRQAFCAEDAAGRALALPVPGHWSADARYQPSQGGAATTDFHVACTSGAIGKCVLLGYAPWRAAPDGASLAPRFEACVRMLRADYGGDGRSWTRDGTAIAWHDGVVHAPAPPGDASLDIPFEAAWGPDGAVCIAHARVPEVADLGAILARYPRLAPSSGPERCTEEAARRRGALLFSRSGAP